MDSKYIALGLFGLVTFQMGADPEGTQQGIGSFFTSANATVKQVPVLFNTDGMNGGGGAPTTPNGPGPGYQTVSLPDGRTVAIPAGYRVVPTGN